MSKDKTITTVETKLVPLAKSASEVVVKDEESKDIAGDYLSRANKFLDSIVEYREKKTVPLNQALKVIRDETRPLETALKSLIDDLRFKLGRYQTAEMERVAREEAEIAKRVKPGKGNLSIETGTKKMDEIAKPSAKVSSDAGSVKFRPERKFEVVDITKLSAEYLLPNETAIRKAMKEGTELPGVKYWTEQVPVNHR